MAATSRATMGKLAITMPVTASLLGSSSPAAAQPASDVLKVAQRDSVHCRQRFCTPYECGRRRLVPALRARSRRSRNCRPTAVPCSYRAPRGRQTGTMTSTDAATGERADLLSALAKQRYFLRFTARGLTDEQAAQRTTASALCVGGAIKHVTYTERQWTQFIVAGPRAMAFDESNLGAYMDGFR